MKTLSYCFLIFFANVLVAQQTDISGNYSGTFKFESFVTDLSFDIEPDENSYSVKFNSLNQNAFGIPARDIYRSNDTLKFALQSDFYRYDFILVFDSKNNASGILSVDNKNFDFELIKKDASASSGFKSKDIRFRSSGLLLYGTVYYPEKPNGKAIYLVTSSGNQDRSASRAEAMLLAQAGYICMITDKRGTGISDGNWQMVDIAELCKDDLHALEFLHQSERIEYSEIGIKGSSQGGAKIPYLLKKQPKLSFGIVVSCPASTLLESDLNYWRNRNSELIDSVDMDQATETQGAVFQYIASNISRDDLESKIKENQSKPWFDHIWIPEYDQVNFDPKLNFSPMPYFNENKSRMLVIEGSKDQIIPANSLKLIEKEIGKKGNRKNSFVLLKGANHSMMQVDGNDFKYWQSLHPKYMSTVLQWIDKL